MKRSQPASAKAREGKLNEAKDALRQLGFAGRQANEVAAYSLLALLNLQAADAWAAASAPLRGITPCIDFIKTAYGVEYAPNTRETIRDEAVKYFASAGLLVRNPDNPQRPTTSAQTVYLSGVVSSSALAELRDFAVARTTCRISGKSGGHPFET